MLTLAWQTLRGRRHSFVGAFVALLFAVALITACGVLVQTGVEGDARVDRYAAAPIVVAGQDTMRVPLPGEESERIALPEPRRLPAALADRLARVAGVGRVVADRSLPATVATAAGRVLAAPDGERVLAHGWSSAALTPYTLAAGRAPAADAEVVLDARLASDGDVAVGDDVRMLSTDGTRAYRVVGLARTAAAPAAVFVTDALAARLSVDPGGVDALGVLLDGGSRRDAVAARVRAAVGRQARVLTGDERGRAAAREDVRRNEDLVGLGGAFGGTAMMLAVFVVAATLGLSVLQRSREIALLRTIGAKPRQVRRLLIGEALVVAVAAGLVALVPGLALGAGLFHALRDRGIGAETTTLAIGFAPPAIAVATGLVTAWLAAWTASRRASRIRPTAALAEAALEPRRVGWIRLALGIAFLAGGVVLCATAMSAQGEAAQEASVGVVMTLMVAVGLLGPLLARVAAAFAAPVIASASSTSGFLAAAGLRSRARRLAAASTPLALAVAFSVAVVGTITVEARATREQSRERVVADRVLTAPEGLPNRLLDEVGAVAGVTAVTGLLPTQVAAVMQSFDGPQFDFVPAVGVSPGDIDRTLNLEVRDGSLAALAPGTVALSEDRADTLRAQVGDSVRLWLGDGHRIRARVVATYASALGFGDVMLARDTVAAHVADPMAAQALVTFASGATAADARVRDLARTAPGVRVADPGTIQADQAEEDATNAWVNYLVLGVLMAFCAIAVVNTLAMATAERSRELALLRLVGATDGQVIRMLRWEALAVIGLGLLLGLAIAAATLVPFSLALAEGALPYVPVPFLAGVVALAGALGLAATELPARAALRRNPADVIATGQ